MEGILRSNVDDAQDTAGSIRGQIDALEQKEVYLAETVVLDGVSNAIAYYQQIAARIKEYQEVFEADALHVMETGMALDETDRRHAGERVLG